MDSHTASDPSVRRLQDVFPLLLHRRIVRAGKGRRTDRVVFLIIAFGQNKLLRLSNALETSQHTLCARTTAHIFAGTPCPPSPVHYGVNALRQSRTVLVGPHRHRGFERSHSRWRSSIERSSLRNSSKDLAKWRKLS